MVVLWCAVALIADQGLRGPVIFMSIATCYTILLSLGHYWFEHRRQTRKYISIVARLFWLLFCLLFMLLLLGAVPLVAEGKVSGLSDLLFVLALPGLFSSLHYYFYHKEYVQSARVYKAAVIVSAVVVMIVVVWNAVSYT